jgi:hypothetical protein
MRWLGAGGAVALTSLGIACGSAAAAKEVHVYDLHVTAHLTAREQISDQDNSAEIDLSFTWPILYDSFSRQLLVKGTFGHTTRNPVSFTGQVSGTASGDTDQGHYTCSYSGGPAQYPARGLWESDRPINDSGVMWTWPLGFSFVEHGRWPDEPCTYADGSLSGDPAPPDNVWLGPYDAILLHVGKLVRGARHHGTETVDHSFHLAYEGLTQHSHVTARLTPTGKGHGIELTGCTNALGHCTPIP